MPRHAWITLLDGLFLSEVVDRESVRFAMSDRFISITHPPATVSTICVHCPRRVNVHCQQRRRLTVRVGERVRVRSCRVV